MELLEINDKVYKIPKDVMKTIEDMSDYIKQLEEKDKTFEEYNKDLNKQLDELEEENKRLSKNQRYYKNGVFSLENDKETMSDMIDDYKSRINKAIEYIEKDMDDVWDDADYPPDDLLKILKGEENEE